MLRPMRPKPLMATLTVMDGLLDGRDLDTDGTNTPPARFFAPS
jgi:hypothetical protein